ncbi:DUF6886 family protein [Cognatiyoonia sp. IB215182]|uniref:DUF6886 family protein n=1 Tax=Cognatiyoonia sp. IB215182 TaxID=3097353 RepID=UPI002A0EBFB0|nr:DUF6886 family protein [Cognatiyoonia sp. IB215182]MDX8351234.1 hypothetical protein [Cognatiyoonia sp. IB215182]
MLCHFSDRPDIRRFDPRPSRLGRPLVWAIAPDHAFLYLFPRECPRILMWRTKQSRTVDQRIWLQGARQVAFVEKRWMPQITRGRLYQYGFRGTAFRSLDDIGMYVADTPIQPSYMRVINNLPIALSSAGVTLRALPTLAPLKSAWDTSLHVSGIRLRNARDWN